MRIGILGSRGFPSTYGGFETLVRSLAPHLAGNGNEVSVYCRKKGLAPVWRALYHAGVRRIETPGWDLKAASTLSFGASAVIDALFRRFDAVLVLNVAHGFYLPLLKVASPRVVVNVDGIEWNRNKWSRVGKLIFRWGAWCTARFADEIICDSREIGRIWDAQYGRRGVYIPYGADVVRDRPTARIAKLGLEPGSFGLVVARLVPENNIDLILDAYEQIPRGFPFVVVGSATYGNGIPDRLARLARESPSFLWLGHLADQDLLLDLWSHCGVYVHGHSVGGTNPALLQALGCGAPTLALDTPFNREVLRDERMLFEENSVLLAARISDTLTNPMSREMYRRIVEQRYQWSDCFDGYRTVLCEKPRSRRFGKAQLALRRGRTERESAMQVQSRR